MWKIFCDCGATLEPPSSSAAEQICWACGQRYPREQPSQEAKPPSTKAEPSTPKRPPHFEGHTSVIDAVSFSADGKLLATASRDRSVRVWDATTAGSVFCLFGHTSAVVSVAFSPGNKLMASGGTSDILGNGDKNARVWDLSSGRQLLALGPHNGRVLVTFSPDGRLLATADRKTIRVWDVQRATEKYQLQGHKAGINALAFSQDGHTLISAGGGIEFPGLLGSFFADNSLRVWSVERGSEVLKYKASQPVAYCTLLPDHQVAVFAEGWDLKRFNIDEQRIEGKCSFWSDLSVAYSKSGTHAVVQDITHQSMFRLHLCDLRAMSSRVFMNRWDSMWPIAISPNGHTAAICVNYNALTLCELDL